MAVYTNILQQHAVRITADAKRNACRTAIIIMLSIFLLLTLQVRMRTDQIVRVNVRQPFFRIFSSRQQSLPGICRRTMAQGYRRISLSYVPKADRQPFKKSKILFLQLPVSKQKISRRRSSFPFSAFHALRKDPSLFQHIIFLVPPEEQAGMLL